MASNENEKDERIRVYKGFTDPDDGFTIETNGDAEHFHREFLGEDYIGSEGTRIRKRLFGDGVEVSDGSGSTTYRKKVFGSGYSGSDGSSVTPGMMSGTWHATGGGGYGGGGDTSANGSFAADPEGTCWAVLGILVLFLAACTAVCYTAVVLWPFGYIWMAALVALQILRFPLSRHINARAVSWWLQPANLALWVCMFSYVYGSDNDAQSKAYSYIVLLILAAASFITIHFNFKKDSLYIPMKLPPLALGINVTLCIYAPYLLLKGHTVVSVLLLCVPAIIATIYFAARKALVRTKDEESPKDDPFVRFSRFFKKASMPADPGSEPGGTTRLTLHDTEMAKRIAANPHALTDQDARRLRATAISSMLGSTPPQQDVQQLLFKYLVGAGPELSIDLKRARPFARTSSKCLSWADTIAFEGNLLPAACGDSANPGNAIGEGGAGGRPQAYKALTNFWSWGPARGISTKDNPPQNPVLNSYVDSALFGDERVFVGIAPVGQDGTPGAYAKRLAIRPGDEVEVFVRFVNDADAQGNYPERGCSSVARDVKLRTVFSGIVAPDFCCGISAGISYYDWSEPQGSWISDGAYLESGVPVRLEYVAGSARLHNSHKANGAALGDSLFGGDGVLLGVDSLDGILYGGPWYAGTVTYRLRASEASPLAGILPGINFSAS